MKLSDRVRPNSEAAPWVVEAIKKMEADLDEMMDKARLFAGWAADGCTCEHNSADLGCPVPCVPCQARAFLGRK